MNENTTAQAGNIPLDAILNGLPVGLTILDPDLRIVRMNAMMETLTGFTMEQARGVPCAYILRSNLCLKGCPARTAIQEGRRDHAEGNIITRDRELVPVSMTATPLRDAQGRIVGVLETFVDLSVQPAAQHKGPLREEIGEIVGNSTAIKRITETLPIIAGTDSSVLITGETGAGKDLVAAVIHRLSARAQGPFVKVNCGALPENLMESELFGHVRGAFTGAERDRHGRFQLAENGTIYLTEIGDLRLPLQVKLLTFLDDREIIPVGGSRTIRSDVRVVAATHRDLESMVAGGSFREDLLYRLNVVRVDLPPLRDRNGDPILLAEHFLLHFREKFAKEIDGFSENTLSLLARYPYPGNVRELRNIVEYAVSMCAARTIRRSHLPVYLHDYRDRSGLRTPTPPCARTAARDASLPIRAAETGMDWSQMERAMIGDALLRANGNRGRAAESLGWGRSTLWRKMKKHGLL